MMAFHFQSHYGAIATYGEPERLFRYEIFQSHYGAIATKMVKWTGEMDGTFNPTMVRLQPNHLCCCATMLTPFNPTMVRLQLREACGYPEESICLSIPLRCDCNYPHMPPEAIHDSVFQSHYGAIATSR